MPGTFSPPPRVSDPDMHHGTCVTHVPWCMSGSLTSVFLWIGGGENVPGIPGACATRNIAYLVRGPWDSGNYNVYHFSQHYGSRCIMGHLLVMWKGQYYLYPLVGLDIKQVLIIDEMPNPKRHVDGLVQERSNSSALAMELSLSCTNPSMLSRLIMVIYCHGNTIRIISRLWLESIGHPWIPLIKVEWCGGLMFSLLIAWTSWWTSKSSWQWFETSRSSCYVIVMVLECFHLMTSSWWHCPAGIS